MLNRLTLIIALVFVALAASPAWADEYSNTIAIFKNAGESGKFFQTAYGYAVFPSIQQEQSRGEKQYVAKKVVKFRQSSCANTDQIDTTLS
jgi:hypothetical protein